MHHTRPTNLNLLTIRFPLTAIASILHRISGFVLFFLIPAALWLLNYSLTSEGFENLSLWSTSTLAKLFLWALLLPFCYHLIAGVRHLLSDMHIGNTREGGKRAAQIVFITFVILIFLVGVWLW